jgi:manganese oxidase
MRNYFIAADEVAWKYARAGTNVFSGAPFDDEANKFVQGGPDRIGSTYTKCLYHAYTDETFTRPIPRGGDEQYLGMLGPVIRAQVGDTIKVTFRNNCSFPASIHPHGVFYDKKYEGAAYNDGRSAADRAGNAVAPHQQYVYTLEVPDRMRTDTVSLLPATTVTADMVPDTPGMWGLHCHVSDHIIAGMLARYEVLPVKS